MRREVTAKLKYAEGPRAKSERFARLRAGYAVLTAAASRAQLVMNRLDMNLLDEAHDKAESVTLPPVISEMKAELETQIAALDWMLTGATE